MESAQFPDTYENVPVREAIERLKAAPTMEGLEAVLTACLAGGLVVDVTGSTPEAGTRVRTIVSTDGHPVLPLFTSVAEVQLAVATGTGDGAVPPAADDAGNVQASILAGADALGLVRSSGVTAVQFNPGSAALVVARAHVEAALETSRR